MENVASHILNYSELTSNYSLQYGDIEISGESDNEEPNQQTVDKYLCSRRHTVGPGDTHHEEVSTHTEAGDGWSVVVKCIIIVTPSTSHAAKGVHCKVITTKDLICHIFILA